MASYKIYCLGHPFLELDGSPIKLEMRKSLAMLVYLRLAKYACSRESLAALFWPEYDQQHAQANLRRALSSLNKSLRGELIAADREKIGLIDDPQVWLDVEEFQKRISASRNHAHQDHELCLECIRLLEEAVKLSRGDFMEGFNLGDCPEFDEWQFLQREHLRQETAAALQTLAESYAAHSAWETAISHARHWVSLNPLHEPAQHLLISLYDQTGQRNEALKQYQEYAKFLQAELGQKPEAGITALVRRILDAAEVSAKDKEANLSGEEPGAAHPAEPLLKTKMYIPATHREKVYRQRLIDQLNQIEQHPLTILSAPAGFGKTTALVEWIAQSSLPVAWYSLDQDDNDFKRFLNYLIATLRSVQSGIGAEALSLLQSSPSSSPQLVLTHLIHDLEGLQMPVAVVLDDYQFITSSVIHNAVSYLLEHLPPAVHFVLATRADPNLRLARLRTDGKLLEIRTNDLRFSLDEAYEYLNQHMGLSLPVADVAMLDQKVEGWIAGLQMAALSMRDHQDLDAFIEGFSGTHRYILDYLLEEVLDRQPLEIQRFLLYTSILDRFSAPLCDAVLVNAEGWMKEDFDPSARSEPLPIHQSAFIVDYLERANLFLVPLDDERIWFRYHHLFADLLRARLQRSLDSQGVAQIHIRAAEWHAEHGLIQEAIHYATLAADDERVERFIEQNYIAMVSRGEMSEMRDWASQLSKDLVHRRPWLCIYEAYSHSWYGELEEADRLLEIAEPRILAETSPTEASSMRGLHAYVKSRVTAMRGDLDQAITLCLTARENIPTTSLALQFKYDTSVTLGYEYFLKGDDTNASSILAETVRSGIIEGAVIHTAAAACILARLLANQGLLHESYHTYQKVARLVPDPNREHRDARSLVEVGMADVLYEWNDLKAALIHLRQGLALFPYWAKPDDLVLAYLTLARIRLAQAEKGEAAEAIGKAVHLVQTKGVFSEARTAAEIAQVRLWLALGELAKASAWLEDIQRKGEEPYPVWKEWKDIASIRVLLALGRSTEAHDLSSSRSEAAEKGKRMKIWIETMILQAAALKALGKIPEALEALEKALTQAQPEGYRRIFLDEGQELFRLLVHGKQMGAWAQDPLKEYIDTLLEGFA